LRSEQLKDLLRYRIEQAHETLREAEILLNESALRGTINRAYYAMFYALLALLTNEHVQCNVGPAVCSAGPRFLLLGLQN
jgi:uncharacterized protein (UPF0332 family)